MKFPYEVRVPDTNDPRNGHDTLEWLEQHRKKPDRDFDLDMRGGQAGYTSFWFKDRKFAVLVKLIWG